MGDRMKSKKRGVNGKPGVNYTFQCYTLQIKKKVLFINGLWVNCYKFDFVVKLTNITGYKFDFITH